MISIIVAMANNRVIGKNNSLPWHLPVDLGYFRDTTMGHAIIMGRRNHEDIGRALPGRRNIVLTRNADYAAPGCEIAHSVSDVLQLVDEATETFVIGGAEIYKSFLPIAQKFYVTHIDASVDGDVVFPEYDQTQWKLESERSIAADNKNSLPCRFCVYQRLN